MNKTITNKTITNRTIERIYSSFTGLFSTPFMQGIGSVFNLAGSHYSLGDFFPYYAHATPDEQDAAALAQDWNIVGKDLEAAIGAYAHAHENHERIMIMHDPKTVL